MIKSIGLTALGLFLAFAIAIGGWVFTNRLINREADRLLSAATTFTVDTPAILLHSAPLADDMPPMLDKQAITSIMRNWEVMGVNRWHEPAPGQMSMEQAIGVAREWVAFLQNYNLLPQSIGFTSQMAFLSQNTDPMDNFLPAEYSYWTVSFSSDEKTIQMRVNAVTGQVWTTEVTLWQHQVMWSTTHHISRDEMQDALMAYVALLGMDAPLDGGDYLLSRQNWVVDEQGAIVFVENPPWVLSAEADEGTTVAFEDVMWVLPPTAPTEGREAVVVPEL